MSEVYTDPQADGAVLDRERVRAGVRGQGRVQRQLGRLLDLTPTLTPRQPAAAAAGFFTSLALGVHGTRIFGPCVVGIQ